MDRFTQNQFKAREMENKNTEVLIVGAGLTGLTLAYYLQKAGKKIVILDKTERVGGVIKTHKKNGFVFESGPNSGSLASVEMAELFEDLQGKCELETANPVSKNRWIWKNNAWHNLPSGFFSAISTPLFTFADKLRILGEPFRKKGTNPQESIGEMVIRRMGKSFLDYAINPFVGGIYAGDPLLLNTKYAFPKLYDLEQDYGSFIRGAIKKSRQAKSEREKKATKEVFSVKNGMQNLTDALSSEIIPESIYLKAEKVSVKPKNKSFEVKFVQNNETIKIIAEKIITTVSAYELPNILPFVDNQLMQNISNLKYSKVAQALLAYKSWKGKPLNAFGGLVPAKENRKMLGILLPASCFSERTNPEGTILSVFMGGAAQPDIINKTDDEIKEIVLKEIQETLQCSQIPDLFEIFRYPNAIAQYEANTQQRYEAIETIENTYKGLFLAGNIKDGIGMAHRVKQAKQLAEKIKRKPKPEAKI